MIDQPDTVDVRFELSLTVNLDAWASEYGISPTAADVRADVVQYMSAIDTDDPTWIAQALATTVPTAELVAVDTSRFPNVWLFTSTTRKGAFATSTAAKRHAEIIFRAEPGRRDATLTWRYNSRANRWRLLVDDLQPTGFTVARLPVVDQPEGIRWAVTAFAPAAGRSAHTCPRIRSATPRRRVPSPVRTAEPGVPRRLR